MAKLRILRKDPPCIELDQSKAIQHKLVIAWVKAALKEIDEGPSSVGHIRSKAKSQSHVGGSGVTSTDEAFFLMKILL